MKKILKIKCKKYNIFLGKNAFNNISNYVDLSKYSNVILISEEKIYNLWKDEIDRILPKIKKILLQSGENVKNINTIGVVCKQMVDLGADRKSLIINIGGGMITDLGGFVASIYMRGIDYVNIPTTLLSMVDASIGGKNGVNVANVKNIIGCFNEPKVVIIDANFLKTLPSRETNSAYGEIIKHSIIKSKKYFNILSKKNSIILNEIDEIIFYSLKIKKFVVESDFKEKGLRKILNFGHTLGHGIEASSMSCDEPFLHGEAVLIGMFFETKIAEKKNFLSHNEALKIYNCLKQYNLDNLLQKLRAKKDIFVIKDLMVLIKKDKKNVKNTIKMVLPVNIGKCRYDISVKEDEIENCLKEYLYE